MKKLLSLIVAVILIPLSVHAWNTAIIGGGIPVAGGGDSCTGNLIYSIHFEGTDDADRCDATTGTPTGCSSSNTNDSITLLSACPIDSDGSDVADGSGSINPQGYGDGATFTTTDDLSEVGSISFWFKPTGSNSTMLFQFRIDSTHYVQGYYYESGTSDYLRITANDGTTPSYENSSTSDFSGGKWIQFGWDLVNGDIRCRHGSSEGTGTWTEDLATATRDIGAWGSVTARLVGQHDSNGYGWFDAIKVYKTENCTD